MMKTIFYKTDSLWLHTYFAGQLSGSFRIHQERCGDIQVILVFDLFVVAFVDITADKILHFFGMSDKRNILGITNFGCLALVRLAISQL